MWALEEPRSHSRIRANLRPVDGWPLDLKAAGAGFAGVVWNSAGVLDERSIAEHFRYLPVRCADLSTDKTADCRLSRWG